jgi:Type ISP C-terminal specificity domain
MEEERDKAQAVKQHAPILVILGNPPYNGFAGAAMDEERDLVTAYRTVKKVAPPQGQGLNDLYVRFFRMAERRITEGPEGHGLVCFISNYSWLDGLSFTGMRERYLEVFDEIWIDCLNGDKYKTGKLTPDGLPDPSVFSTEKNHEGIQVGTAVALLARCAEHEVPARARFANHWGKGKLAEMQALGDGARPIEWQDLSLAVAVGLPLLPAAVALDYFTWPLLPSLFPVSFPGVKTSRDEVLIDTDRDRLVHRMEEYFSESVDHEDVRRSAPSVMIDTARFRAVETRERLRRRGLHRDNFVRYCYRPFDNRWLYWEPETKLLDEKRAEYFGSVRPGNLFLFTTSRTRKVEPEPALLTSLLTDLNCQDSGARGIALFRDSQEPTLLSEKASEHSVSDTCREYVESLGVDGLKLMLHSLACLHSQRYRRANASALRHDWPRIPLPAARAALLASAEFGRTVAALLDVEEPVEAVTTGSVRHELRPLGVLTSVSSGQLDPSAGDLAVTAGWGHGGKGGVTMPGRGRTVERPYTPAELAGFREGLSGIGLSYDQLTACLGGACYDVYLSDLAYWRCVPARVWKYTIGGYQVMKKWLSYRERALLGRDLKPDEARYVTEMTRRIAAIRLLEPALEANYAAVKADTYPWPGGSS